MTERACILSLSHKTLADLEFHREWHQRCGCDYRAIWQTAEKQAPDWAFAVDIPGKIVITGKMRIYCHFAAKLPQFERFVFLDYDGVVLDREFVGRNLARMEAENKQVIFTHLTESPEHYKAAYYAHVKKAYKTDILAWSLNVCTFVSREAALFYDEHNDYKIYDEVDFACFARAHFRYAVAAGVVPHFFTAGRADGTLRGVSNGAFPPIVHAVKDYSVLAEVGLV